jgi:hypothetical protein
VENSEFKHTLYSYRLLPSNKFSPKLNQMINKTQMVNKFSSLVSEFDSSVKINHSIEL